MGIYSKVPVNRLAATVTSKGFQYTPDKKIQTADSDVPLPIRDRSKCNFHNTEDVTGKIFGRFKVLGLSATDKGRWVVRCNCGIYSLRARKAIVNPENTQDRCELCRHDAHLRRAQAERATGKRLNIRDF